MQYLVKKYPQITTIVHISVVTAGPLIEHGREAPNLRHYWLDRKHTVAYSNLNVFDRLHRVGSPDDFLKEDDEYLVASYPGLPHNADTLDLLTKRSGLVRTETVVDRKSEDKMVLLFYVMKYRGEKR
jgi:hypothetical protein